MRFPRFTQNAHVRLGACYRAEDTVGHERIFPNSFPFLLAFWLKRINHFRFFQSYALYADSLTFAILTL